MRPWVLLRLLGQSIFFEDGSHYHSNKIDMVFMSASIPGISLPREFKQSFDIRTDSDEPPKKDLVTEHEKEEAVVSATKATVNIKCPLCYSDTSIRTAKRGDNAGRRFHVCVRYPECKGRRNVE